MGAPKPAVASATENSAVASKGPGDNPVAEANNGVANVEGPEPATVSADDSDEKPASSTFEALQRKFESHKVTPISEKPH